MSPIEEMLRQALSETPTASTSHDPLGVVDRRVRRARARLAFGGTLAVLALVAAVLLPLTLHDGSRRGLQVAHSPSPATSRRAAHLQPAVLIKSGVKSVVSDGSSRPTSYVLVDWQVSSGAAYVAMMSGDEPRDQVTVQAPADRLIADNDHVWVLGADGGRGLITVLDPTRTAQVSQIEPTGPIVSATVAAGSLFVVTTTDQGTEVDRYVADSSGLGLVGIQQVPHALRVVADGSGTPWLQTDSQLIELKPGRQLFTLGLKVPWNGDSPVFGPAGPGKVWAYDGRLIELSPRLLQSGVSVAEGARLQTSGRPIAVATARDGGVYIALPTQGAQEGGVIHYSGAYVRQAGDNQAVANLGGINPVSLAIDPRGGVDVVGADGRLEHWQPESR